MNHPDFKKSLIQLKYFEDNIEFAKQVIAHYENEKEKNASWYGPKIPFYITMPKLTNNYYEAKKAIRIKELTLNTF